MYLLIDANKLTTEEQELLIEDTIGLNPKWLMYEDNRWFVLYSLSFEDLSKHSLIILDTFQECLLVNTLKDLGISQEDIHKHMSNQI